MNNPVRTFGLAPVMNRRETIAVTQALLMGRAGYARKLIAEKTGLSVGQVSYKLKQYGVKLTDYREGKSPFSIKVLDVVTQQSELFGQHIYDEILQIRQVLQSLPKQPSTPLLPNPTKPVDT